MKRGIILKGIGGPRRGQHLLEYVLVVAIVAAAVIAMYPYLMRAVQSIIKLIEKEAFK